MPERGLEMRERPAGGQDRSIPVFGKRHQDHPDVRQDREKRDRAKNSGAEQAAEPPGRARAALAGRLRHHRVAVAPEKQLSRGVEEDGRCQQHRHQRERERVSSDVLDPRKNLDRRHAVEREHERHAKLGERPDEDDRAARKQPRHDERQRDFAEFPEPGAAEVFRRLLHRGIHVGQRRQHIEVEDRVKVERVHDDHPPEPALAQPVHRVRGIHEPERFQERVERARLTEDLLHPDRPDKRRQDHRDQDECSEQGLSRKKKPVADHGERQRDGGGEQRAEKPHQERIPQPLEIDGIAENLADIIEGERPVRPDKRALQSPENRPDKKQREERRSDEEDQF